MQEVNVCNVVRHGAPATCRENNGFAPTVPLGRWFGIELPEGARADQIKAELHDGVLTVSVPVAQAVQELTPTE